MDAEAWAATIESEMVRGIFRSTAEAERTTFEELLVRYEKEVSPLKKGYIQELSKLQVIKRAGISKYSVAKIGGKELAEYRDARLEKVSPKTVRNDLVLIGHVFKVAMQDWGMVLPHGNPIDAVRKPKVGNNKRDRRLVGFEEELLIEGCRAYGGEIESIVLLALETGMRRGEIAALTWSNINKDFVHLPDTKNDEPRDVPLSTRARKVLSDLPRRLDGQVFTMKPDSITRAFDRICKRLKIEGLRFHDLRHEATSRFFELGLNPMQVSAITGHKTIQMLSRYTHLKASDLAKMLG
jgi:integrase